MWLFLVFKHAQSHAVIDACSRVYNEVFSDANYKVTIFISQ